jgi:hypothetical protein
VSLKPVDAISGGVGDPDQLVSSSVDALDERDLKQLLGYLPTR